MSADLREGILAESGEPPDAVWLALEPDPVLAFLHLPPAASGSATAVLICAPFGWEENASYRARRRWAQALAAAGFAAARIDFPGSGDSGGSPRDPGRVEAWTDAVVAAAGWLRERTASSRVAMIGIGLGGVIGYRALTAGAPIDDLVLWAVPGSGRVLLRELKTYAGVVAARYPADARGGPPLPEGDLELIGYLLSAETASQLEGLRLAKLEPPRCAERRVLMISRDGLPVDKRLREWLVACGAEVTVADASDYEKLMAHPQEAQTPADTISRTIAWLREGVSAVAAGDRPAVAAGDTPAVAAGGPPAIAAGGTPAIAAGGAPAVAAGGAPAVAAPPAVERESIELEYDGHLIRETPVRLELAQGPTLALVSEPVDAEPAPVCAVLLNGGALRHTGPNRTWVEIARRWAARCVPAVRVDLQGIGDAEGDERGLVANPALYAERSTAASLAIIEQLGARGLPDRFVLAGLCSGAYWALHAALRDPRVAGALMINLYAFYWSEALVRERETFEALGALREQGWRRIVRRDVRADRLMTAVRSFGPHRIRRGRRRQVERSQHERIERDLDRLRDQGTEALLLLSYGEPLYDQLVRQGQLDELSRWPNLTVERIPSRDHMFRALWLQQHVHASLDSALERVLARAAAAGAAGTGGRM